MIFLVYLVVNTINNSNYIGWTSKSIENRFKYHCYAAENGSDYIFHKAIRKYGKDAFKYFEIEAFSNESEAQQSEIYWISQLKKFGHKLYNMTDGGEGRMGSIVSTATRKKLSIAGKARKLSEKHKKNISISSKNRKPITQETKNKMSNSASKKIFTEEHKKNIGDSIKAAHIRGPIYIDIYELKKLSLTYSLKEIAKIFGCSVSLIYKKLKIYNIK